MPLPIPPAPSSWPKQTPTIATTKMPFNTFTNGGVLPQPSCKGLAALLLKPTYLSYPDRI